MATPSFIQFRTGIPFSLPDDQKFTYTELKRTDLQDYYLRIIHELALQGKLTRPQVDLWLKRLSSKDPAAGRTVRGELDALRSASVGVTSPTPTSIPVPKSPASKSPASKRKQSEKVLELVSRGDHKQAVSLARGYGLHPLPISPQALRPGQSPDAHTVRAVEAIASKLITTGNWKSAG